MRLNVLQLVLYDIVFVAFFVGILMLVGYLRRPALAVLKRNFVGYFSNPTGYAFLCLFVFMTSAAAFVPYDFFASNMANLDQLNRYLPLIMLIFIPAITMSIWAEERREGTDELLLTLPANDFDIVIGKFLAASSIFTASLLFAQLSNFSVLVALSQGNVDAGLLFTTYMGYWLVGLAMISLGMVATFLTNNLTISFLLGALFNLPLIVASYADAFIPSTQWARAVASLGIANQFEDLGRGVLSVSSVSYFLMVTAIGIYLSMLLIGRRHWLGGRDGKSMLFHYLVRAIALFAIAAGITYFFSNHDVVRVDATEGRISSLSPDTKRLLADLDPERPIQIEAFVSGQVPEAFVQTKYDLLSMLKEFGAASSHLNVIIHNDLETFGDQAIRAEELYGIEPQRVLTRTRGTMKEEEILLGAAFTSGVRKVVVPFFEYGVPVEYELIRSIDTVAKKDRPRLGLIRTEANLNGGFSMAGGMPRQIPKQEIITELEKQYEVEDVDASSPIDPEKYQVLMVAQPSSLAPPQFENLLDAIRNGVPTAIFEDPSPQFIQGVTPTGAPKQGPGGMFGGGGPQPKADIQELWKLLGITSEGAAGFSGQFEPELVWQKYIPYRKLAMSGIPDQWIFASNSQPGVEQETGADMALNGEEPITSGLDEVLFPIPGFIKPDRSSDMTFVPLVTTGTLTGTISFTDFQGIRDVRQLQMAQGRPTGKRYVLAARIAPGDAGEAEDDEEKEKSDADQGDTEQKKPINVVYVSDIDLLSYQFMRLRARPDDMEDIQFRFENVTFVLNIIDYLSGDDAYLAIRKRKPRHSTLRLIEKTVENAYDKELDQQEEFQTQYQEKLDDAKAQEQETIKKFTEIVEKLQQDQREGKEVDQAQIEAALQDLNMKQQIANRKRIVEEERLKRELDSKLEAIQRESDQHIQNIQSRYKLRAVMLPVIPPILIGIVVWVSRRMREREGISKARMR